MKITKVLAVILIAGFLFLSNVYADDSSNETVTSEENTMAVKFKRGLINIATSPLEIPKQIRNYWNKGKEKNQKNIVWVTAGTVKGIANMVGRLGSGVWDVTTFNVNMPKNYEPLMKPDFVNSVE